MCFCLLSVSKRCRCLVCRVFFFKLVDLICAFLLKLHIFTCSGPKNLSNESICKGKPKTTILIVHTASSQDLTDFVHVAPELLGQFVLSIF